MNISSRHIVDIYHGHAHSKSPDDWARRHVHGLNLSYLKTHGFPNEEALVLDFKKWLRGKDIIAKYANAPAKEMKLLNCPFILDIGYPEWSTRPNLMSHQTARDFKKVSLPIGSSKHSVSCPHEAHAEFKFVPTPRMSHTELAKKDYGFHCSLYDAYALYLHYVTNN